jgi:hypothetical protein
LKKGELSDKKVAINQQPNRRFTMKSYTTKTIYLRMDVHKKTYAVTAATAKNIFQELKFIVLMKLVFVDSIYTAILKAKA